MWWHPVNMRCIIYGDCLNPMKFDFDLGLRMRHAPDAVFAGLGLASLVGETMFPLVLISRWARAILPLAMISMHIGILLIQNILFLDLILIHAIFYDWRWLSGIPLPAVVKPVPSGRWSVPLRWPAAAIVCLLLVTIPFCFQREYYPFTAWMMYSNVDRNGVAGYCRYLGHREDGQVEEVRFEKWIGALADTRYRDRTGYITGEGPRANAAAYYRFLEQCLILMNHGLPKGQRFHSIEVQFCSWDFLNDPNSSTFGVVRKRYFYPIESDSESASKGD
jgi:hypothetical protein